MQLKRPRSGHGEPTDGSARPTKRSRPAHVPTYRPEARGSVDLLTGLSDELLVRILSFLSLDHLLAVAPVSRRLSRLAADSQLWKSLYYGRFVLPRAMRIPGFRDAYVASRAPSAAASTTTTTPSRRSTSQHRLH